MQLKLTPLTNAVFVGDKLPVRSSFHFDEEQTIFWSGLRLLTSPPCQKDLQISQKEIFSKGLFESGEYIRERALTIENNVVPTIKKRDLSYRIQLFLRKPNPINPDDDIIVRKFSPIVIKTKEFAIQKKANPISFSISGLNVELNKDIFKPGETIKINYKSEGLREIEIRLLQKANLICYCEQYGKSCKQIEELPPAIAGDVKTRSNTDEGYLLLKVPEIAEPSHNYLWEPKEKKYWGTRYGDYCEWFLLIIGKRKPEYGRDAIRFELPITITQKPIKEEEMGEDLFSRERTEAPSLFEGVSSQFKKEFEIISIQNISNEEEKIKKYKILIRNRGKEELKGATIKLSGLQEGLFETPSYIMGFNKWSVDEEKEIIYQTKQEITALISLIEDNSQKTRRLQTRIQ